MKGGWRRAPVIHSRIRGHEPTSALDINNHILEASEHMTDKNTRHITVTDQGKVVGIITVKNTFSYYMNLFGLGSYDPTTNAD